MKNSTLRAAVYIIVIAICVLSAWGCGGEYKNEPAKPDASENRENKTVTEKPQKKNWNPYFPYSSDQEILFDGRFYFSDLLEKQTTVYIKKESSGEKGEIWHITFKGVEYDSYDSDGRYPMPDECLDLYYFLIQDDIIYWYSMPEMPAEEKKAFCEEGVLPKDYIHIVCQENEKKDVLSDDESGDHEEISVCGRDKNIRQYKSWYVKPDFSDTNSIYTFVFKKNEGLIAYRNSWTAAGKNAVQLWDGNHVSIKESKKDSGDYWKEFIYKNSTCNSQTGGRSFEDDRRTDQIR